LPTGAVDVRVSTLPTQYGESVVMRLLNQGGVTLKLKSLELPDRMSTAILKALKRPSGMILVTGPTGSGKTTTLYGALGEINTTRRKVITVEDPIEYRLPGLTQVQVNDKIELGFDKVLRSALRQDPDVVLVGEIRDSVTAEIAMRGAMTGHLVLSTLHSNDAPSTPVRLLDMGVASYMVAISLQLIIAQRLVKKLCGRCAVDHVATEAEKAWISKTWNEEGVDLGRLRRPVGCKSCHHTGYSGRQPVFEFIEMNRSLMEVLTQSNPNDFVRLARTQMNGFTMARDALDLAIKGITSVEEAILIDNSTED
jgi:MSHA biogenesis protein MshE